MKSTLYIISFISIFFCASCSEVGESERYIELPQVEIRRNVLVEEFTGQRCTNCPDAHRLMSELQRQYGNQLIVVAIHAGGFGISEGENPNILGLMQEEGNVYADRWGVEQYPSAVVNRQGEALSSDKWASSIRSAMERSTNVGMTAEAKTDGATITCGIAMEAASSTFEGKLQIWVTEDDITALQIDNGAVLTDYTHNHVFRACVKKDDLQDEWGEDIVVNANIDIVIEREVAVRKEWNIDKLNVVAFLYNDIVGVAQVVQTHVERQ